MPSRAELVLHTIQFCIELVGICSCPLSTRCSREKYLVFEKFNFAKESMFENQTSVLDILFKASIFGRKNKRLSILPIANVKNRLLIIFSKKGSVSLKFNFTKDNACFNDRVLVVN